VDVTDAGPSGGLGGDDSACKRGVMGGETDRSKSTRGQQKMVKRPETYHQEGAYLAQLPVGFRLCGQNSVLHLE
jgi:hypothetical protein